MDIRRFGPGHRRPDGPPGTQGVTGQVIHSDERGSISELAFGRRALITPHSNPNHTLFIIISGGGFVQVGEERARVNHGEAVVWPAGELHGAYTEGSEMRAIIVELPDGAAPLILEGHARPAIGEGSGTDADAEHAGAGAAGLPTAAHATAEAGTAAAEAGRAAAKATAALAATRAEGRLAERERRREDHDETEGEPW